MIDKQKQLAPPKDKLDLRVQLRFKPLKCSFKTKNKLFKSLVQGLPYKVVLIVTNISNKAFKGASLKNGRFSYLGNDVAQTVNHDVQIPAINSKGKVEVELDVTTFDLDGGCWLDFTFDPESKEQEIQCYQYEEDHARDEAYDKINSWGSSFYIEGKLASLQTKTNNYILALTIITVLEAIFGIKNILLTAANMLAIFFSLVSDLFQYLGQFT